jgi:pimeloyl-ACP methyl ester carboxylesterase
MRPVPPPVPPDLPGLDDVRRSFLEARGVRFHITEAGERDGAPVLLLHGWPQHHLMWRHLLAAPPPGVRLIAPDLPGYGWSGPAPHRWAKEDVASDLLALLDALGLGGDTKVGLVGHDWGGWVGHLMVLREPQRFSAYLALNIAHPWVPFHEGIRTVWRFAYQVPIALFGVPLHRYTPLVSIALRLGLHDRAALTAADRAVFADRFRHPDCARTARDTYRTFLARELLGRRSRETRRSSVPTLCLFGTGDTAVSARLASPATALADDYRFEAVEDCGHFIVDERPGLVAARVSELFAPA